MTTDHTGTSERLANMPELGFFDTLKCTFACLAWGIFTAVLQGIWIFLLVAFGIPLILGWLF